MGRRPAHGLRRELAPQGSKRAEAAPRWAGPLPETGAAASLTAESPGCRSRPYTSGQVRGGTRRRTRAKGPGTGSRASEGHGTAAAEARGLRAAGWPRGRVPARAEGGAKGKGRDHPRSSGALIGCLLRRHEEGRVLSEPPRGRRVELGALGRYAGLAAASSSPSSSSPGGKGQAVWVWTSGACGLQPWLGLNGSRWSSAWRSTCRPQTCWR